MFLIVEMILIMMFQINVEVRFVLDHVLGGEILEEHVELLRAEKLETQGAVQAVAVAPRLDDFHFRFAILTNFLLLLIHCTAFRIEYFGQFRFAFFSRVREVELWNENFGRDFDHASEAVLQAVVLEEGFVDLQEN